MPQSRAQRRRQQQRQRPRPTRDAAPAEAPVLDTATPNTVALPSESISVAPSTAAVRPGRASRRAPARALEPVDYSADYAASRRDLTRIFIISGLLFAIMIGLRFSGLL